MSEDRFEEFLQREAQAYNEPPVRVPREEMFAAISERRAGNRLPEAGTPKTPRWRPAPQFAWIGMAATLVLGVAIGKYVMSPAKSDAPAVAAAGGESAASPNRTDTTGTSYVRAANLELARAEALLTAYGSSAPNAGVDKQLSSWARDILENTRLLLDSPAADDPARRKLLQDLELVLVQMVQRSPTAGAGEERSHIDRSLDRTQVLTRLRSALPAGRNNGI